jgi:AcrR family transcriptional regulator
MGFDKTTMADIAERAEFAVGTLYKFFKNKEELYRALMIETFREMSAEINRVLGSEGNEVERLERYIDKTAELYFGSEHALRLYFHHANGRGEDCPVSLEGEPSEWHQRIADRLDDLFQSGIRKGHFVDVEPRMLRVALEGLSATLFRELSADGDARDPAAAAELCKHIFLDAVRLKPRIRLQTRRS